LLGEGDHTARCWLVQEPARRKRAPTP